jgi:hypothetical protein
MHKQPSFDVEAQNYSPRQRRSSDRRSSVSIDITVPGAQNSSIADQYGTLDDDVVGLLDCVDTEVGTGKSPGCGHTHRLILKTLTPHTVNHLQNVTNGLMFPHVPMLWSRRTHLTLNSGTDEFTVVP